MLLRLNLVQQLLNVVENSEERGQKRHCSILFSITFQQVNDFLPCTYTLQQIMLN